MLAEVQRERWFVDVAIDDLWVLLRSPHLTVTERRDLAYAVCAFAALLNNAEPKGAYQFYLDDARKLIADA